MNAAGADRRDRARHLSGRRGCSLSAQAPNSPVEELTGQVVPACSAPETLLFPRLRSRISISTCVWPSSRSGRRGSAIFRGEFTLKYGVETGPGSPRAASDRIERAALWPVSSWAGGWYLRVPPRASQGSWSTWLTHPFRYGWPRRDMLLWRTHRCPNRELSDRSSGRPTGRRRRSKGKAGSTRGTDCRSSVFMMRRVCSS
jgi:hypothetical protein